MNQVTVIITSYNKAPFLKEAIDSCLNQTFKDFELLIIDDGSSDKSLEIIESYSEEPQVRILTQENRGVIYTRNRAIKEAKGDYVLQLDGDDKLGAFFLEKTVPVLNEKKNVGIVFCQTELFGEKNGVWDRGEYTIKRQLTSNLIVITALFRKLDFNMTNGYNEDFKDGLEDWDFWLTLIELGRKVIEVSSIQFYYRIELNSRNHIINDQKNLKRLIFENHTKLYLNLGLDPVNLLWEKRKDEDEINSLLVFKNSMDYKVGNLLLSPLRFLKKLFR